MDETSSTGALRGGAPPRSEHDARPLLPASAAHYVATVPDASERGPRQDPLVTIGLPVYNGEQFLAEALESLLGQTFRDFEIVVSDNASTDASRAIVMHYAELDPRIRLVCNDRNRGAAWNANRVLELARGKYFRWASHDDTIEPEYLSRCVDVLDGDPDVVLCTTGVVVIDEAGNGTDFDRTPIPLTSPDPAERFRGLVMHAERCYEVFGLVRRDALESIPPIGGYGHADGVTLCRLALLGRFEQVPDRLINMRKHADQSMSVYGAYGGPIDFRGWSLWFDPDQSADMLLPHWRRLFEYLRSPWVVPGVGVPTTVACLAAAGRWAVRFRSRLAADAVFAWRARAGLVRRRVLQSVNT
jgi:glycosyltransferase involved in cell wall biosynthesis